jgi:peptidoglycan/xylan/chitin deacetylase (PgdA/CDA1 family)
MRPSFLVLGYHEIGDSAGKYVTTPQGFADHISVLRDAGCRFVSMEEVLSWRDRGTPLPDRAVVLHFDDARTGVGRHAAPLLVEQRIPATVYVVSAWSAGQTAQVRPGDAYSGFMGWTELRALRDTGGFTLGCHSQSHPTLRKTWPLRRWREIDQARRQIAEAVGDPVEHFAAPYNRADFLTRQMVKAAGFRSLSVGRSTPNGEGFDPFRIHRYMVTADWDAPLLARLVETTWPR